MMSHTMRDAMGLGWLLARRAMDHPTLTALTVVADPQTTSLRYAELDLAAGRLARRLRERLPVGARVLLLHPTGPDFAVAFLGCLYAGMVAVPVPIPGDHVHHGERLAAVARDAGPAALLTDPGHETTLHAWRDRYGLTGIHVLVTAELAASGDPADPRPATLDALAMLQYTSGSTGSPRGVMISHGNLIHNITAVWSDVGLDGPPRAGGWLPLYHDMGLALLLGPLVQGGTSVLMPPADFIRRPYRWLRLIDEFDLALSVAPDFAYALCVRQVTDEQLAGLDLRRWRRALNGSEPVRAETVRRFTERFAPAGLRPEVLTGGYGLAEATVYVAGLGPDRTRRVTVDRSALAGHTFEPVEPDSPVTPAGQTLVSCGRSRHLRLLIVDPDTRQVLPEGRIGEIWLRGESVAQGYWGRPTETADTFGAVTADGEEGFLRTGDLGALYDGMLYVTGRIKETLLVRGRTLYPHDIEALARIGHPELRSGVGAAFTVPATGGRPGTGDQVVLVHEVRGRPEAERLGELVAGVRTEVATAFGVRLDTVVLTRPGAIPRTTSGKVRRGATRDLFLTGGLPVTYVGTSRPAGEPVPTGPAGRTR